MINKIIDGVDVSGCEHFCRADCCSAFYLENADDYCPCEGQECNYKRLIRLEQENERLKQSEEEGLEINAELEHYLACMTEQRNKLKLALEEIREISQEACSSLATNLCRKRTCEICGRITDAETIKKILIKISEVLK